MVGQLVAPWLASLSASPRAGGFAAEYLAIRSLGAPLVLVYAALREASYGVGDTRTPMRASLAGQTIRVRMTSTNDFFRPTSFYFDTLSLRALHCP